MDRLEEDCKACMYNFIDTSLKHLPLGIMVVDYQNKNIRFMNQRAEQLLKHLDIGFNAEEIIEKLGCGKSKIAEGVSGRKIRVAVLSYLDIGNNYAWYFMYEMSEDIISTSYECELSCMLKMDFLLSIIRHELGNPLNAIKVTLEVLRESFDKFSREKKIEYLERSLEEIRHMELLLKWLRDYKLQGRLNDVIPVRLKDIAHEVYKLTEAELSSKKIQFFLFCEPKNDVLVWGDPQAIRIVLLNVIKNAIEALEGVPNPTISVAGELGDKYLYLMIRDNGRGIPNEVLPKIFTPLFTTKKEGSGLGLAISKNLMLKMGGNITIKSEEGEGTEVTLIFRRVENAENASCR